MTTVFSGMARASLVTAYLAAQSAIAAPTPKPSPLDQCSDTTLFQVKSKPEGYDLDELALKIGCALQSKIEADILNDPHASDAAEGLLHAVIKDMQIGLNLYKNDNAILSVLPDLKTDGILGPQTARLLYGFVRDTNNINIFFDINPGDTQPDKKLYMRNFRDYLISTAPLEYAQDLRLLLEYMIQSRAPAVTLPEPKEAHDCPTSQYGQSAPCPVI